MDETKKEARDANSVRSSGQRRALYGRPLLHPVVPEDDLARVRAAEYEVRMEPGEGRGHDGRLTVEDELGRRLLELGVPDETDAVRIVGRVVVVVVGGDQELGELGRPVHRGDATVARPALVVEEAVQPETLVALVVPLAKTKVSAVLFWVLDDFWGLLVIVC